MPTEQNGGNSPVIPGIYVQRIHQTASGFKPAAPYVQKDQGLASAFRWLTEEMPKTISSILVIISGLQEVAPELSILQMIS